MPMGMDWDDICAFKTYKTVNVRHKWLGIVYYSAMLLIVVYTVAYRVVWLRGYEAPVSVAGAIRSSVQAPPAGELPPVAELPYCTQSGLPATGHIQQHQCIYPDFESGSVHGTHTRAPCCCC